MSFTCSQNPKPLCNHTSGLELVPEYLCLMYQASKKDSLLHMLILKYTSQSKTRISSSMTLPSNIRKVSRNWANTHTQLTLCTFLTYICIATLNFPPVSLYSNQCCVEHRWKAPNWHSKHQIDTQICRSINDKSRIKQTLNSKSTKYLSKKHRMTANHRLNKRKS